MLKNIFVNFFGHQKKPAFMLTHGIICNIQLSKNLVLNPKDGEEMTDATDWDMTLFTCTYGGRERYALRCIRQQ